MKEEDLRARVAAADTCVPRLANNVGQSNLQSAFHLLLRSRLSQDPDAPWLEVFHEAVAMVRQQDLSFEPQYDQECLRAQQWDAPSGS